MTAMDGQLRITTVPVTVPVADRYIRHLHRHHAPLPGGFAWFCIAAVAGGYCRGVAVCGRPTNRNNAGGGQTVEVLRLACDGTPNVASALYGACARTARAMGAARIITYTLETESGASLRGAGWVREADGIRTFWQTGHTRARAVQRDHMETGKVRWALDFRDPIEFEHTAPKQPEDTPVQDVLFSLLPVPSRAGLRLALTAGRVPGPPAGSRPGHTPACPVL